MGDYKYWFLIGLALLCTGCATRYPHNLDLNNPKHNELVVFFNELASPENKLADYLSENAKVQAPDLNLTRERDKKYYTKQEYLQSTERTKENREKIGRRFGKWELVGITTKGEVSTLYTLLDVYHKTREGKEEGSKFYNTIDVIKANGEWKVIKFTVDYNAERKL